MTTDLRPAQIKLAVDAVLASARLQVTADEYEQLLRNYPVIQTRLAEMRFAETRYLSPADIFRP